MADQKFSFPLLSNSDITMCLNELGVPFSESQLVKPQAAEMKEVYARFLELLTGVSEEENSQPQFIALEALEFPELHEESIGKIASLRKLCRLMSSIGVPSFGLTDITRPEYERTRRSISAIVNFAKFRNERMELKEESDVMSDTLKENKGKLVEENKKLAEEYRLLEAARQAEQPQIQALEKEIDDASTSVQKLKEEHEALLQHVSSLQRENAELAERGPFLLPRAVSERADGERRGSGQVRRPASEFVSARREPSGLVDALRSGTDSPPGP